MLYRSKAGTSVYDAGAVANWGTTNCNNQNRTKGRMSLGIGCPSPPWDGQAGKAHFSL